MGKPRMIGYQKPYTPNNRADYFNKKRGRHTVEHVKLAKDIKVPSKKEAGL